MEPKDFWNIYMQGMRPADFMSAFDEADPAMCVTEYVRQRPSFHGIVRRRNWRETFVPGEPQFTRESVRAGLITHLEETRPEWEAVSAEVRQRRQEDRRRRVEEATRAREAAAVAAVPAPVPEPEAVTATAPETVSAEMAPADLSAPIPEDVPVTEPASSAAD
jgi:hypothetical protein